MDVSAFFSRLVQPGHAPGETKQPDDLADFEAAWAAVQETLLYPDERQIVRGIASTDVPRHLRHMVDALVYENNRTDENETGVCFEYFLRNDVLSKLESLSAADRPHGEVLRVINNLVVLLSDHFLIHNSVHRPLRRLLRSCVGDEAQDVESTAARLFGATGMDRVRGQAGDEENFDGDLVDLMCILCSKIRAYPPLLLIFFHDKAQQTGLSTPQKQPASRAFSPTPSSRTARSRPSVHHSTASRTDQRFEFLLFSYLLRFVHREGRTGDFARAGLLFLFDIAFLPLQGDEGNGPSSTIGIDDPDPLQDAKDALGEFILDGDFPEVMAAAIGAVYSLFPSKIHVPTLAQQGDPAEDDADVESPQVRVEAGSSTTSQADVVENANHASLPSISSQAVQMQLDLFLKLFGFLQDIITRCSASPTETTVTQSHFIGASVASASLASIRASFLENVLHPALLESSPHDGTAVAVMSYLHVLLGNLDDGSLLSCLQHFLFDTDPPESLGLAPHHQAKRHPRNAVASGDSTHSDAEPAIIGKFTLKALIVDNLGSASTASRTAALQLLHIMLQEHCAAAVDNLLSTGRPLPGDDQEPMGSAALDGFSELVSVLDPNSQDFESSSSYTAYLSDIYTSIQADPCFRMSQIDDVNLDEHDRQELARALRKLPHRHTLDVSDSLTHSVLSAAKHFLSRTADENVALCSVIISLASCSRRTLSGWLLASGGVAQDVSFERHDEVNARQKSDELDNVDREQPWRNPSTRTPANTSPPALLDILRSIVDQITSVRASIATFDALLRDRRRDLLGAADLDEAMSLALTVDTLDTTPRKTPSAGPTTPRPTLLNSAARPSLASSIKDFFSPRRQTPSRTSTSTEDAGPQVGGSRPATPARTASGIGRQVVDQTDLHMTVMVRAVQSASSVAPPDDSDQKIGAVHAQLPKAYSGRPDDDTGPDHRDGDDREVKVTLDRILDNVIILEELLKEIVAVITVRRALGIDPVTYV